ncbi:MAG: class I SAM-dependent methyltransferase [Anaerolineae bacterium]|nr:class I SAM-dependent methyltransferase [Anaerolineae bacterium]
MIDPYAAYARFYDLEFEGIDMDLLPIEQFARRAGSPILELACGTGRVLLPLARAGFEIVGVDLSPAMLEIARRKVAHEGLQERVTLVQQDMRVLALDRQFNMVLVAVNSFSHLLTLDDQLATLSRVREHLRPGGLLFLDLFNPDLARLVEFEGQVALDKVKIMDDPDTGRRVMRFRSEQVDLARQVIDVTYVADEVDAQGNVKRTIFPYSMRYLFRNELKLLLRHAGFHVEAIYGSYDLDEFDADSEKLLAVAIKTG